MNLFYLQLNLTVLKRLGRINNLLSLKENRKGIKIVVSGETVTLYFDKNLDLDKQKVKISNKVDIYVKKITNIKDKLKYLSEKPGKGD